jgi:hypothetical protein
LELFFSSLGFRNWYETGNPRNPGISPHEHLHNGTEIVPVATMEDFR